MNYYILNEEQSPILFDPNDNIDTTRSKFQLYTEPQFLQEELYELYEKSAPKIKNVSELTSES